MILFLTELQVFLHALRETNIVAFVNRVGVARWRVSHTLVAQAENTERRIVGKGVYAAASGVNHHG